MTRKDYSWTTLINDTGNTSIQIATDVTASFVAGDVIWLEADDGAYSASGTVVSSTFGAATTVITTVPYVANNAAGYINTITHRPNYYVGIGVYKSTDNTLIGTVNYYPTKKGLLTIDISQPIQSDLDSDIPDFDGKIVQDVNTFTGYYIKYTEFWTGSAESTTDDVANIGYAIFGARQIGRNNEYSDYISLKALTNLDTLQLNVGEYYCLSYISHTGGIGDWIKKSWYDLSGTLLCITYIKSTNNTTAYAGTSVPIGVYTLFQKFDLSDSITPDRNINNAGTIAWSSNTLLLADGTTSKSWVAPFFLAQNKSISFSYSFSLTGNATNVTPKLYLFDSTGTVLTGSVNIFTGSNGTYTGTGTITNSGSGDAYFIGFDFANASGANKTLTLNSLTVSIPSATRVDFKGIILSSSTTYSETAIRFATIIGYVTSCLKNPITLFWRNNLGGESSWTFNFNQELVQKLQDPYKNKQYTLFDQNLTLTQFNALNDLFTLGQIYQTPIIELTDEVNKTEARIGQQVYIIDPSNGVPLGVIVLPGENKTLTKRNKHIFQVTIELPEIFG
jgi:hypothetical protein